MCVSRTRIHERMVTDYRDRIADDLLRRRLEASGAVLVEGAKAVGKTATARQFAASEVLLDVDEQARRAVEIDPGLILEGPVPRLIDEWQIRPAIWNHVRRAVDDRGEPGQFILAGSARPTDDVTRHTGAGRISRLHMRPMSLLEAGHATGSVSLGGLLERTPPSASDPGLSVRDLAERIAVGGWPGHLGLTTAQALQANRDYLDEIRRTDVQRVDGTRRDPLKVGRLLRSLARHVATTAATTTLAADTGTGDERIRRETVSEYLDALERLMIVEHQDAWAPHLRSRSRVRTSAKRHFVDPSLAVAALRASPERLLQDLELLGLLFESLVVRDLRIYGGPIGAEVLHYRDNTGLEVDAVIETADGTWGGFEVKLSDARVDEAAASLKKFADRVDTRRCGEPAVLGVIVATGYAYRRDDGVSVIPVATLGP